MAIKLILRYLILCCIAAGFFACSTIRNSNKMKEPTVQIETTDGNIVVKLYNNKVIEERYQEWLILNMKAGMGYKEYWYSTRTSANICFKLTFLGWMLNSHAISYLLGYIKI